MIHEQIHGYKFGHELLGGSTRLDRHDQDSIDRLSDLAGPLSPGEQFSPYLTAYPLPSGKAYVVARTWQDLQAPRAGCVVTRSLIFPMDVWASGKQIGSAIALLKQHPDAFLQRNPEPHVCSDTPLILPLVEGAAYSELTEALFLEQRRPIAVFDFRDAEVAALRILQAVWPGLRKALAVCTRAGSPRQIGGRAFDLLFAPGTARPSFGRWEHRRIDGAALTYQARHRWTEEIVKRIFGSTLPHTLDVNAQHLFDLQSADESVLRLSLLWNELLTRSVSSPFAVLGLLDIVDLLDKSHAVHEFPAIEAALDHSLTLAAGSYPASEFFDFTLAFLGKFPKHLPAKNLLRRVRRLIAAAAVEPQAAVDFLRRSRSKGTELPAIVVAGLGDGLAPHVERDQLSLADFGAQTAFVVLSYSRPFAKALVRSMERRAASLEFELLAESLRVQDDEMKARARRHLIPNFTDAAALPLLTELLHRAPAPAILQATRSLWRGNKLAISEFDRPILQNADEAAATLSLRSLLVDLEPSENVDRLIVRGLSLRGPDFDWIRKTEASDLRKQTWLVRLLASSSVAAIGNIPAALADDILSFAMARSDLMESDEQVARLVVHGRAAIGAVLPQVADLASRLEGEAAASLASTILRRMLQDAGVSPLSEAVEHLNRLGPLVDSQDLVVWLTPNSGPIERVSENLLLLAGANREVRRLVQNHIDILTERVTGRLDAIVHKDAVAALASCIETAEVDLETRLRAASSAWKFSADHKHAQVSALVVASFPIIYAAVAQDVETPPSLRFFSFFDWDRCRALRSELVDVYMRSEWPPHELVLIADRIGQVDEVVDSLWHRFGGTNYYHAILSHRDDLPMPLRERLERVSAKRLRRSLR